MPISESIAKNTLKSLAVVLLMFILILICPLRGIAADTIFYDNFSDGNMNGWTLGDSNASDGYDYWGIANDGLYAPQPWCAINSDGGAALWFNYDNNMDAYMRRYIDLSEYRDSYLRFDYYLASEEGYDYLAVKINGTEVWKRYGFHNWDGQPQENIDLSDYDGQTVTIEFLFHSDSSVNSTEWDGDGAYVDNIGVYGTPGSSEHCYNCPTYDYGTYTPGTSYSTHSASFDAGGCRWYRFNLTAGNTYYFTTCEGGGSYSDDTVFTLYNSSCSEVAYNDDHCNTGSHIVYTPTSSGYHYLQVENYNNDAESYTLAHKGNEPALPDLLSWDLDSDHPEVYSGESFTARYEITNDSNQAISGYLILRTRSPAGVYQFLPDDGGNDAVPVTIAPGTHWFSRQCVVYDGASSGSYRVTYFISPTTSWADAWDLQVVADAFTVKEPSPPDLLSWDLDPDHPEVYSGESFTARYEITNDSNQAISGYLMLRTRSPAGVYQFLPDDGGNDAVPVTIAPGTHWYSRQCVVYDGASLGSYRVTYFISPTTSWGDAWDLQVVADAFDVASPPVAKITSRSVTPTEVDINEPFTITVTAKNEGGLANWGGISVSFSEITENGKEAEIIDDGSDIIPVFYGPNEPAPRNKVNTETEEVDAQYMLVEMGKANWATNESHTIKIKVLPKQTGTFRVNIRFALVPDGTNPNVKRDPTSGVPDAQQTFPVYQHTVDTSSPDILIVIDNYVPNPSNPGELVSFEDMLDTAGVNYTTCDYTEINNGTVDLQQMNCILLTNESLKKISQYRLADENLIIYNYTNEAVDLPMGNTGYDPFSKTLTVPSTPPDGLYRQPVPIALHLDTEQFLENADTTFVAELDPTNTVSVAMFTNDFTNGEIGWGVVGVIDTVSGELFVASLPACVATFEFGGGTCHITAGLAVVKGLTMGAGLFRDALTIETVETDNSALNYNPTLGNLQYTQVGTINCNAYYVYDDALGYLVLRSDAPSICPNYAFLLDAQGGHFTFDDQYLYNEGTVVAPPGGTGTFSEPSKYKISTDGTIEIDIEDNIFEYSGTYEDYNFIMTPSGSGFQTEVILGDTLYSCDPSEVDFVVSHTGVLSTILSVGFQPPPPGLGIPGETFNMEIQVGMEVGQDGILQVLVWGGSSTNETVYKHVLGGQSTFLGLNVPIEEPVGGSESYMVYVQFRPGATEGPLDTTELSDVVAEYQNYQINWSVSPIAPTPVYPSDNETIGNLTPTFLWSTFQDGGDGGTQAGYQLRVRCDDEGDLVVYDTGLVESTSVHSHTYTSEGYSDPTPGFTDNFREAWDDTYSANGIWRKSGPWAIPSNNTFLRQENVSVQNGMIILTVPADEYEGGQIESVDSNYHYGYYEARIKASAEPGVVNAFFMWSPTGNNNEIDVEFLSNEFGLDSGMVHFVLHPHDGLDEGQYHIEVNLPFNPSDSFNNYAFEWSVNYVKFFVNGQLVGNMPSSEGCPVPSQPGNLLLSNWSGGLANWGDGPPTVSTTMQVEWARFVPENSEGKVSLPLEWGKHYHWHVRYRDSSGDWSDWSADNNPDPHQDFYTPAPAIEVIPASRDFGSIPVGSDLDMTFTVKNIGGGTLTGNASMVVGSAFTIFSGDSYSLAAGQTQTITVRFSPTAAVAYSDTVTFTGAQGATRPVAGTGVTIEPVPTTRRNGVFVDLQWAGAKSPGDIEDMLGDIALHGLDTVYVNVYGLGGNLVCNDELGWNPEWGNVLGNFSFSHFIAKAHDLGLQVVASISCFHKDAQPSSSEHRTLLLNHILPYFVESFQQDGKPLWPFDGIALDYVRYVEPSPGETVVPELVTEFVTSVKNKYPNMPLGAFVLISPYTVDASCEIDYTGDWRCYGDWRGYVPSLGEAMKVGQHWENLVHVTDFLLPMAYIGGEGDVYHNDLDLIKGYVATATEYIDEAILRDAFDHGSDDPSCNVITGIQTWIDVDNLEKSATPSTVRASLAGLSLEGAEGFFAFRYFNDLINQPDWVDALSDYSFSGADYPRAHLSLEEVAAPDGKRRVSAYAGDSEDTQTLKSELEFRFRWLNSAGTWESWTPWSSLAQNFHDYVPGTTARVVVQVRDVHGLTDIARRKFTTSASDTAALYNGDFEIIDPLDSSNPDGWTLEVGGRDDPGWGLHKDVLDDYYYSGSRSIHFRLIGYSNLHCYGIIKSPLIDTVEGVLVWYQSQKTDFDASDVEYTIKFYDGDDNLVSSNLYYTDTTTSQAGPGCAGFLGDSDMSPPAVMAENGGPAFGGGNWYKFSNDIPDIDTDKFRFEIHIYQWEAPNKSGDGDACGSAYYGGFDNFYIEPESPELEELTQLTTDPARDNNPVWSPTGDEIIFGRNADIYKIHSDGLHEMQLTNNPNVEQRYKWSPDNTKILYDKDNTNGWNDVWLMDIDGNLQTDLTNNPQSLYGVWSPDGSKIAYVHGSDYNRPLDIIIMNADGSNKHTIVTGQPSYAAFIAWSPDASRIAFSSGATGNRGIRVVNVDGTGLTQIASGDIMTQTQSGQTQVWSPDGSKIVYHSDENGNWDIYTINIDGTEKRQLTTDDSDDRFAYFSPDGRKIVFVSNRSGNNDIWVMEGDGSNKVQLTTDRSDDIGPSWNPHGDKIAFMSDRSGNYDIWMMTLGKALDSDNDGLYDYFENAGCTDTFDADTDDDGISDGAEDANKNGVVDPGETDPCNIDTDGDGIQDGTELGITEPIPDPDGDGPLLGTDTSIFIPDKDPTTKTDPLDEDSDSDGLSDGAEINDYKTNPLSDDSDADGYSDGHEVGSGSNPSEALSYPATTTINLTKGFNLIVIPADVTMVTDLRDWLPVLGDVSFIEKALVYDHLVGKFITLMPGDLSSQGFVLNGGEGLIVYAKQDKEITFTSVLCSTLDLNPGFNLVGFACAQEDYSAYQLLSDLGSENVTSIQRYSTEKGSFETAGFDPDGQLVGVDFPILRGEGYFIFMKQ